MSKSSEAVSLTIWPDGASAPGEVLIREAVSGEQPPGRTSTKAALARVETAPMQAEPPTRIGPAVVATPAGADEVMEDTRPGNRVVPPTVGMSAPPGRAPESSGALGVIVGMGVALAVGVLIGLQLAPKLFPPLPPPERAAVATYLEGAEVLVQQKRYEGAKDLLDRARALHTADPALNVKLVGLSDHVGIEVTELRLRRALALGDVDTARKELMKLADSAAAPERVSNLRQAIEDASKGAPANAKTADAAG
ncbi:MAG: hypothetical protein JST54_06985 [Deltaproteobacteria bacterium]|nr:hypothetical protein [Deltaproteobacteria bacterium]